jgi:uncharacterized protein YjbI with pentapeptide repeats/predicted nucleic acid-binding protein
MTTAVDSNILIALWNQDDSLNVPVRAALDAALRRGALVIAGPVFAELSAAPSRTEQFLDSFCRETGIWVDWNLDEEIWRAAGRAFQHYVARRGEQRSPGARRILADFLIGAHAMRNRFPLLTLDDRMYKAAFPRLVISAIWAGLIPSLFLLRQNEELRNGGEERNMGLRKLKSLKHNGKKLVDILEAHQRYWASKQGGARADLTGADLSGADLSKLNLAGAVLRNANLEGSDLRGARLPGADFSGARLRKADLRNTDMTEAHLSGADLREAQASGVEFFRCDLTSANFERALLRNANFRDANVDGAKFTGADMGIAILRETDISKADLSGVDLSTALMPPGYAAKTQKVGS